MVRFFCRFEGKSGLCLCAEFGGRQFLRKVDNYVRNYKVSRLTRQQFSHSLPWEMKISLFLKDILEIRRSQWPRGLRRRFAAARLLRSWVRIPPGTWMFFCCECCVLACRGLCDEFITRPEESYRPWCVVECNLETAWWGGRGSRWPAAPKKKKNTWDSAVYVSVDAAWNGGTRTKALF